MLSYLSSLIFHFFPWPMERRDSIQNVLFFFYCGRLGEVRFPFTVLSHPECGLLMLDNCNETFQRVKLGKDESWFNISDISQDDKMTLQEQVRLVDERVLPDNHSCEYFKNVTINSYPFISFELLANQVFFRCPANHSIHQNLGFSCNDSKISFLYPDTHSPNHSHINLPSAPAQCSQVPSVQNKTEKGVQFLNLYTRFFYLRVHVTDECVKCHYSGGQCQSDSRGRFHCSDTKSGDGKLILKLVIVLGTTAGIGTLIVAFYFRRKIFSSYMFFWRNVTENDKKIQEFLRNYESFAPKRYRYSDIKKMTNSFRHKIGQGGYGVVYKGRLPDGRNVAVKVLVESKGNGEEFINEVASISRTSHVNIVSLSGFCFEGRKRALIYEFVANGSLEKFIYTKNQLKKDHQLNWETLNRIALGIARGLEYLHRGCSTRILHFDIKPHNILLDEDFCPKISDFGLAKVCPRKESIVSMIGARGTIGYIAPEVVSRNFGEVSHKSDVFSYGMMVLEMVGGRRNFDVRVDNTSEIYFPHWIYQRLKVDEELGLQDISNDEDKERARKMIIVSLWCIQANPSDRPTISTVVEMLEGSLVSLQIPPKPFLYSPRSQAESFKLLIDSSI